MRISCTNWPPVYNLHDNSSAGHDSNDKYTYSLKRFRDYMIHFIFSPFRNIYFFTFFFFAIYGWMLPSLFTLYNTFSYFLSELGPILRLPLNEKRICLTVNSICYREFTKRKLIVYFLAFPVLLIQFLFLTLIGILTNIFFKNYILSKRF